MSIELNPEQRAAAECLDRPVLVTAGAGSGKTRMLTQRFANAVIPGAVPGWEPASVDELVAITFTDKAAGEIAERVRLTLRADGREAEARELSRAWISTIHGLCSRLLRRHSFEAGVDPLFAVGDTLAVGRMRETAFEDAARGLISEGGASARLFDAMEYSTLFSATLAVARELAVAGYSAGEILLEPTDSGAQLVAAAGTLFREGMTTCDLAYSGSSKEPWLHRDRCEELLGRCSVLVSADRREEELLGELLAALEEYKPMRKLKGFESVTEELTVARDSLVGRVAAAITAPYAVAFKRLVTEYAHQYSASKSAAGMLDFDDLQIKAVQLLEDRPDIARAYRERFRVVMIDEFQDTDALQLRLVEALTTEDLCTVGDEKQSIYRFRGADISVYREHRAKMEREGALIAELGVNYRSHPDILAFVNALFSQDDYFGGSLLRLEPPGGERRGVLDDALDGAPRVEALFVDSTEVDSATARVEEARAVAERLATLCEEGARASDIAILVRTYTHAHTYAEALSQVGIRAVVVGGSRFFGLPEVAIMRALNRVIANPEDGAALGDLLASDFVPMSSDALAIMRLGSGERDRRPLWQLLQEAVTSLDEPDGSAAERLVKVLQQAHGRVGRFALADILLLAVEEAGWDLRLLAGGNLGRDAFANVLKFVRQASAFEASAGAGPAGFAAYLEDKERLGDTEAPASLADDGSDAVRIMSIHASKGLEFPIVVVPGLASNGKSDQLSVRTSRQEGALAVALKTPVGEQGEARSGSTWFTEFSEADKDANAEESARVFYVACTRAQEFLLLSGAMGLRPARETKAKNDLVRLARMLGLGIPVSGASDMRVPVRGSGHGCRTRVMIAQPVQPDAPTASEQQRGDGILLPPAATALEQPAAIPRLERISYTQLAEFEHCPRQFWVRRVLGMRPSAARDAGALDPLQFGSALHTALRLVGDGGEPPEPPRLSAIARFYELGSEGERRLAQAVARYCVSDTQRRVVGARVVRRESPFSMDIASRFLLVGSIDLYARTGDEALVVDYKSGETGEAIKLRERYELQARCYALAVLRDGCSRVTVEFVRPEVDTLGSEDVQRVTFSFSAADAGSIEGDLIARYEEIERSPFEPLPSDACRHCGVSAGLCPESKAR